MKNQKSKIKSQKYQQGFTLIELLVVMVVLVVVGTIVSAILFSALRGTNKTKAINNLENNGNYVIAEVAKISRFAKYFDGVSVDDQTYTTNCSQPTPPAPTPTPTPVSYKYLKITSYDGGQTTFICSDSTIASRSASTGQSVSMIDTETVTLTSCSFSCKQSSASDFPTLGISFSLTQYQPTQGLQLLPEKRASANFQTTVSFRNFHR